MMHISDRISAGEADVEDVNLLNDVALNIQGKCLCALGEFATMAVVSGIERFRSDFEERVNSKTPQPAKSPSPEMAPGD